MNRIARLDALVGDLEALPEPARGRAMEAVAALLEVYGESLRRIAAAVDGATLEAVASDELVGQVLLVHDLHPLDLRARVARALDAVRPYLGSHGGDVAVLDVDPDAAVVRLRLDGSCDGCPSSRVTLKLAIEDAILEAAPEIERVVAEGMDEPDEPAPTLGGGGSWEAAGPLREAGPSGTLLRRVAGEELVFVRLDETLYAYRPACPGCGASLADASLLMGDLLCVACGERFDVRGAGRCRDAPELSLEPVPLLVGAHGTVRVALGAAVAQP